MTTIKTLIIGSSCFSCGITAAKKADTMVIDRSAGVGAEYFNSYQKTTNWNSTYTSSIANQTYQAMLDKNMFNNNAPDVYGCAALLYGEMKNISENFSLLTELDSIKKTSDGFETTIYSPSGEEKIFSDNIIDTTPLCISATQEDFIAEKYLNTVIYFPDEPAPKIADSKTYDIFSIYNGRSANEKIVKYKLKNNTTWIDARSSFISEWENRDEELKGWLIASIGKEFEYSYKTSKHEITDNHIWYCPSAFSNPLAAFDAGFSL